MSNQTLELRNIERIAREYVAATKCTCPAPGESGVPKYNCWHCVFEYNLRFVEEQESEAHEKASRFEFALASMTPEQKESLQMMRQK